MFIGHHSVLFYNMYKCAFNRSLNDEVCYTVLTR